MGSFYRQNRAAKPEGALDNMPDEGRCKASFGERGTPPAMPSSPLNQRMKAQRGDACRFAALKRVYFDLWLQPDVKQFEVPVNSF